MIENDLSKTDVANGVVATSAGAPSLGEKTEQFQAETAAVGAADVFKGGEGVAGARIVRGEVRHDGEGIGTVAALSPASKPTASGVAGPAPAPPPPQTKK